MDMTLSFPGGFVVEAAWKGHTIRTDQPIRDGGTDTAPAPFDLFLASIATCMGFYAVRFCTQREIPTDGLAVSMSLDRDHEKKRISKITVNVRLPDGFPEKYRAAILRAMETCAVKRHVLEPPEFELVEIGVGSTT